MITNTFWVKPNTKPIFNTSVVKTDLSMIGGGVAGCCDVIHMMYFDKIGCGYLEETEYVMSGGNGLWFLDRWADVMD